MQFNSLVQFLFRIKTEEAFETFHFSVQNSGEGRKKGVKKQTDETVRKLLVCVSASPSSAQLIQVAKGLAVGIGAEFLALHVEEKKYHFSYSEKKRDCAMHNMQLAESLGAKTITIIGTDFAEELLGIMHKKNITAVVVGKPKRRFSKFFQKSLVEQLLHSSDKTQIYVIPIAQEKFINRTYRMRMRPVLKHCIWSLGMVAAITLLGLGIDDRLKLMNMVLLYLIPVLFSAFWWGRWPSYLSAISSVLCFDFLFVLPVYHFSVEDIGYYWSFIIFLIVSTLIGGRTEQIRSEARRARQQALSIQAIYEFSREITAVIQPEKIAEYLAWHAGETMNRQVIVKLSAEAGIIRQVIRFDPQRQNAPEFFEEEVPDPEASASSVQECAVSEETVRKDFKQREYVYLPLVGQEKIFGVLGICVSREPLTPHERRLAEGWTKLAGLAMERGMFAEQARQVETLLEADKLRNTVFNSISHELKTPLSVIIGSVSVLTDADMHLAEPDQKELLLNMKDSTLRMERLVANLLDTARLENGMMKIKPDWCDVGDLIATACKKMKEIGKGTSFALEIDADLFLIKADCTLIEQVIVNLIDNAIKYSPKQSTITVRAEQAGDEVKITVLDQGKGIPEGEIEKIFHKFYRVKQPEKISGTGLGLSICKGIIEAHGGKIYAFNRPEGGAGFSFILRSQANTAEHEGEAFDEQEDIKNFSD